MIKKQIKKHNLINQIREYHTVPIVPQGDRLRVQEGYWTYENDAEKVERKPSVWEMFKKDFGGWSWSKFWFTTLIFTICAIVFETTFRLVQGPTKLIDGQPCPLYLELIFSLCLHYIIPSTIWVLGKLWDVKAYISTFIKLSLLIILTPLILVVGGTRKRVDSILDFLDKMFTKKEQEIIKLQTK